MSQADRELREHEAYGLLFLTSLIWAGNFIAGKIALRGDMSAVNSISLGQGVPSTPLIRQRPASVAWNGNGQATVTGGQYEAVIQTGAATRTDELEDTTVAVDLGTVDRRADILSVAEME